MKKTPLDRFEERGLNPWDITRRGWVRLQRAHRRALGQRETGENQRCPFVEFEEYHREAVKQALSSGVGVLERVLRDYPGVEFWGLCQQAKRVMGTVTVQYGGAEALMTGAYAFRFDPLSRELTVYYTDYSSETILFDESEESLGRMGLLSIVSLVQSKRTEDESALNP